MIAMQLLPICNIQLKRLDGSIYRVYDMIGILKGKGGEKFMAFILNIQWLLISDNWR
jgi:hypothetical protein